MELFQNGLGNQRALAIEIEVRQGHHAVQIAQAGDIFRQDDDVVVLLPVGVRVLGDFVDHIAFHAIDDLLLVLIRQVLDFRKCLDHAVVGDSHRRMMPLRRSLDDFLIIDESIQTHFCMKVELHARGRVIVLVINLHCLALLHLLQFQHQAAGVFVQPHIAPHLHRSAGFQGLYSVRLFRLIEKFLARDAIGLICQVHEEQLLLAPKLSHLAADDRAHENHAIFFTIHGADLDGVSDDVLLSQVHAIHGAALLSGVLGGRYEGALWEDTRKRGEPFGHGNSRPRRVPGVRHWTFRHTKSRDVLGRRHHGNLRQRVPKREALHGLLRQRHIEGRRLQRRHVGRSHIHPYRRQDRAHLGGHIIAIDENGLHAKQRVAHILQSADGRLPVLCLDIPGPGLGVYLQERNHRAGRFRP